MKTFLLICVVGVFIGFSQLLRAEPTSDLVALVSSVQGEVQILEPITKSAKTENQMTYEGKMYHFENAKIGQKIHSPQAVMSKANGRAKIIYQGGDIFVVGPNSFVSVALENKTEKTANLVYGRVRAVINPEGSLSGLKIKTPSAVAGIRGTDLYIAYDPNNQKTKVETIRGKVEVTNMPGQSIGEVSTGQLLVVGPETKERIAAREADHQDLADIQSDSRMISSKPGTDSSTEGTQKEISAAEKASAEMIIKDIARYDQKSAQKLQAKMDNSVDTLLSDSLYAVYVKAPPAAGLKGKDDELYKKYFDSMGMQKNSPKYPTDH